MIEKADGNYDDALRSLAPRWACIRATAWR
jgi:hypothetical protein